MSFDRADLFPRQRWTDQRDLTFFSRLSSIVLRLKFFHHRDDVFRRSSISPTLIETILFTRSRRTLVSPLAKDGQSVLPSSDDGRYRRSTCPEGNPILNDDED